MSTSTSTGATALALPVIPGHIGDDTEAVVEHVLNRINRVGNEVVDIPVLSRAATRFWQVATYALSIPMFIAMVGMVVGGTLGGFAIWFPGLWTTAVAVGVPSVGVALMGAMFMFALVFMAGLFRHPAKGPKRLAVAVEWSRAVHRDTQTNNSHLAPEMARMWEAVEALAREYTRLSNAADANTVQMDEVVAEAIRITGHMVALRHMHTQNAKTQGVVHNPLVSITRALGIAGVQA